MDLCLVFKRMFFALPSSCQRYIWMSPNDSLAAPYMIHAKRTHILLYTDVALLSIM